MKDQNPWFTVDQVDFVEEYFPNFSIESLVQREPI